MVESGSDNLLDKDNVKQSSISQAEVQEMSNTTLAPLCDRINAMESNLKQLETLLNTNVLLLQNIQTEVINTKLSVLHLTENILKDAVSRVEKNTSSKKEQDAGGKMNKEKSRKIIIDALFPDAFIKDHPILSTILANPNSTYRTLRQAYPNIPIPPGLKETDHIEGSEEKWTPTLKEYIGKYRGTSSNTQHTRDPGIKSVVYAIVEYIASQIEQFDKHTLAAIVIGLCSTILFLFFAYLKAIYFREQKQVQQESIFDKIKFW